MDLESVRRDEISLSIIDKVLQADKSSFRLDEEAKREFVITRSEVQLKDSSLLICRELCLFLLV